MLSRIDECQHKLTEIIEITETKQVDLECKAKKLEEIQAEIQCGENLLRELYKEIASAKNMKKELDEISSSAEDIISNVINNVHKKLLERKIDGSLANIILQEANKLEVDHQKNICIDNIIKSKQDVNSSGFGDINNLFDFVYEELNYKAYRKISRNDIVNILICFSQGFLTVLAGEPGTGKSSLINHIAKIIGLSNTNFNRYIEISVEKGWTSRNDFIGYYNPLNKTFETTNRELLNALNLLNYECEQYDEEFPFLMMLDEANLSQMEYYWADFMGICDMDKPNRSITLSDDVMINIPHTLKFFATINIDHTTEAFSPRLIDRAWIIKNRADDVTLDDYVESNLDNEYDIIPMSSFDPLRNSNLWNNQLDEDVIDKFSSICDEFKEVHAHISPRLIGMIKRYCLAGERFFEGNKYTALDYAVAQKILPKINGHGEKYEKFIAVLLEMCKDSMPISYEILLEIDECAKKNMSYFQYFAR